MTKSSYSAIVSSFLNPLMGTSKLQSNGQLYSNTMIGTLVVDGCYIWYSKNGPGWAVALLSSLFTHTHTHTHTPNVQNVTAQQSAANVLSS